MLEQTRVNEEVWLPRQLTAKIDVRLALLKNFNVDVEQTFRDYKKFRATTKISPWKMYRKNKPAFGAAGPPRILKVSYAG